MLRSTRVFKRIARQVRFGSGSIPIRTIPDVIPKAASTTIGKYLADRLASVGANHYFTVPGDYTLSLLDEFLKQPDLTMVSCCNELNAGYAADGYARATGGLATVMVTYMVGGLSAINAVAGAYSDDLPVLLISGGPNYNDAHQRHIIHHTIGEKDFYQQSKCYEPIVAKTFVIRHASDAASMIDQAISTAINQRKPVYLEIPVNLANYTIPEPQPVSSKFEAPRPSSDPVTLEAATRDILQAMDNAVKPVLVAGSKLRTTGSVDNFIRLADTVQAAVAYMPDAKGLLPESHPYLMGRYWGTVSSPHVAEVVESSDLVILAGPVLNDYTTVGWSALLSDNKLIKLNPDNVTVGTNYYPNVQLYDILENIANAAQFKPGSWDTYQRYIKGSSLETYTPGEGSDSLSLKFIKHTVEQSLTSDSSLIIETGDSWFIGQSLKLPDGAKYNVQMQYGSIGWSVGATLGVALAEGDSRRVIAFVGDGSFQMTAQEVSTMIRYKAKAVIILLNNYGYTIEVQIHDGPYNDIKNWSYKGLIDAMNAEDGNGLGLTARNNEEFTEALRKSEEHDGLTLIECFIGRDDCTKELLEWGSRVAKANGRR